MSQQKISHYKVPYKIEDGELVLEDSKREFIKDEPIDISDGGVMRASTSIGEANSKEKELAIGVGEGEGFLTLQYLT